MIYIIKEDNRNRYKIGYTDNIKERIKTLKCGNSDYLFIKYLFEGNKNDEKKIHKYCLNYNIKGEWYKLNELNKIIDYITQLNLKIIYKHP